MKAFIVYPTYRIVDGRAVVHLFGRLDNGKSFLSMHEFRPYLFIKQSDMDKAMSLVSINGKDIEQVPLKNFAGEPVMKIYANTPKEIPEIRGALEEQGVKTYESDIRFAYRFLMDNGILGTAEIDGESREGRAEDGEYVDLVFESPKIGPSSHNDIRLKTLSVDIETDINAKEIYAISFYTDDYKEVFIVSGKKLKDAASFGTELELLQAFSKRLREIDPDIITGWNFIDFDLDIIQKRFKHYNIPFKLGRNGWDSKLKVQHDFLRSSSADFPGRAVLDGINLLKISFISLDDYKLETAAQTLLGRGKLLGGDGDDRFNEIEMLYRSRKTEDNQKLVDYNLMDSQLVYEILEKKKILDLTIQKSLITGLPLDKVKGSVAALDMLYIREARKRGYVCPASGFADREERVKGAFVMQPKFGIYENILVLDFKSLYPSIIRTFNIDPLRFTRDKGAKGLIVAPNGAGFLPEDGILPMIIQELWKKRDDAKKEKDKVKSNAIKIIMNSFYGVLANPSCRFYSLEVANAITSYAREIVQETAAIIKKLGYDVIYGDTDSVFVVSGAESPEEADRIGELIQEHIDRYYMDKVKKQYGRKSYLNLEYEKLFKMFLLPKIRGQETGAKKRYAGLLLRKEDGKVKEDISITGLEFVRRDWTELAKEFQMELLHRVFHKKDLDSYIKEFVDRLKKGELDGKLVYRKAIRKDLDEYVKTTPPHVKAARQLGKIESNIIEYYITVNGPEPIQKHRSQIDYDHYLDKQLRPIAESILALLGKNFDDIAKNNGQKSLADF